MITEPDAYSNSIRLRRSQTTGAQRRRERLTAKHEKKIRKQLEADGIKPDTPDIEDEISRRVDEDLDDLDIRRLEKSAFCERLSSASNMDVKTTGGVWYNANRRIGRIWKSYHRSNIQDNTATILIFRNRDTNVYRLTCPAGKEIGILSQAISKGYILTTVKVNYQDVED